MKKKWFSFYFLLLIFAVFTFCAHSADRDTRRPRDRDRGQRDKQKQAQQLADDAAKDIQEKLAPILELVNENESLSDVDLEIIFDSIKENKRFVSGMDPTSQAEFFILSAWANYFQKQFEPALKDSTKALKADPDNSDAKATMVAMALLNRDYKAVNLALKEKKAEPKKRTSRDRTKKRPSKSRTPRTPGDVPGGPMMDPGMMGPGMPGMEGPMGSASRPSKSSTRARTRRRSAGQGALTFDAKTLNPKMLGQKIEPATLKCINGSLYEFPAAGSSGCVLIYKTDYSEQDTRSDHSEDRDTRAGRSKKSIFEEDRSSTRSKTRTKAGTDEYENETAAFYELFSEHFDGSDGFQFAAINAQHRSQKQQVIEHFIENPSPWPQIMLDSPAHRTLAHLKTLHITQPLLLITDSDGKICYAAQADSFMPEFVLSNISDMPQVKTSPNLIPEEKSIIEDEFETPKEIQPLDEPEEEIEISEPQPKVKEKVQKHDETQDLIDDTQAGKLYEVAKMHYKKGKYIGYGNAVKSCREIIEQYPETQYAGMARDMLRQIPRRKREQFNVTEEELGVK